ncbi:unnamed protein product [Rotaria sordida]|uniref:F-box domain-containing protein n=1 Tax=Rotaria sordida TaxID=392033 RepID=A0A815H5P7_9BILA|nr:unnamed protein product [Rotaria sordida]CAF1600180.1 unnamed protein product [Rotaria sordida]
MNVTLKMEENKLIESHSYSPLIPYAITNMLQKSLDEPNNTTNFELLPNEIFLYLFNYMDSVDLLHAFYGLNSRFNRLLYEEFRSYRFHFDLFSKRQFDMICQRHLPFIIGRFIFLRLSDSDETPGQINHFFSYIPSMSYLTHLRCLIFYKLCSYETLIKIVHEFHHLSSLTYLELKSCSFRLDKIDMQMIVNNIWNLPKLASCYFDIRVYKQETPFLLTQVSTSLRKVFIYKQRFKWNELYRLFECTPHLKCLRISVDQVDGTDYQQCPIPTLIYLNISGFCMSNISKMMYLLQNIPNLRCLKIRLSYHFINGYQWEQIIKNYLPKLKTFLFDMYDVTANNQNIEEQANELMNSFRSSFWIDEHQWFVRCFIFDGLIYIGNSVHYANDGHPYLWKSTYPNDNYLNIYKNMTHIYNETFFHQSFPSDVRLPSIEFLWIELPIKEQFWTIVPSLNQLYLLSISSYTDTFQLQLQRLLDQASHLCCLEIKQHESLPLQISFLTCINTSIRQLYLQNHWFDEEECITVTRSPLGVSFEVLFIKVKTRENILILMKNMINLRALTIQFDDDMYSKVLLSKKTIHDLYRSNNDSLLHRLKHHLPSTCLVVRDADTINLIHIWIS